MTKPYPDFTVIRNQARFETVLARYGLETRGGGTERMARCPFHEDRSPSCSINLDKKVFHCFACGEKGTILDFVARMESCSIVEAVRLLAEWCRVGAPGPQTVSAIAAPSRHGSANEPLGFELHLDPCHPYPGARGLSPATIMRFGLGYCDRGTMKGRVCFPIHDELGQLVAYVGRWPEPTPPSGEPRYRFPRGFEKRRVLFNFHRVAAAPHLVIVEGFWSVFRLDALGIAAVALMGCTLSAEQEEIIRRSPAERITLLLDGDRAGRAAVPEILARLVRHRFVRVPELPENTEPDTVAEDLLMAAIRTKARHE